MDGLGVGMCEKSVRVASDSRCCLSVPDAILKFKYYSSCSKLEFENIKVLEVCNVKYIQI